MPRLSVLIKVTFVLLRSMTMALECQFLMALLFLLKNFIATSRYSEKPDFCSLKEVFQKSNMSNSTGIPFSE